MKRGPKSAGDVSSVPEELVKSTYKLQKTLKRNLQVLAMEEGKDQADIVRDALVEYLRRRDIDPTRSPTVVTYRLTD